MNDQQLQFILRQLILRQLQVITILGASAGVLLVLALTYV
jgi:hypothetical protein